MVVNYMSHTILKCIQLSGIYYFHDVVQLSPSSSSTTFSSLQEEAPCDLALTPHSFPPPSPWQPLTRFLPLWIYPEYFNKWSHSICDRFEWLLSLSKMFLRVIHIVPGINASFLVEAFWFCFINFDWSIVALQCCVNFCCAAK